MKTKLRVCPFCGASVNLYINSHGEHKIECDGCGIATEYSDESYVVDLWNARDILHEATDANDNQIYTFQERADLLFGMIEKYNKYED
jgi:hypothetical protein